MVRCTRACTPDERLECQTKRCQVREEQCEKSKGNLEICSDAFTLCDQFGGATITEAFCSDDLVPIKQECPGCTRFRDGKRTLAPEEYTLVDIRAKRQVQAGSYYDFKATHQALLFLPRGSKP